jgi:hypothetical protein
MCPILLNRRPEFSLTNCRNRWRPPELQEHSMGIVDFSGTTLLSLFFHWLHIYKLPFTIPPSYTSSTTHKYTNTNQPRFPILHSITNPSNLVDFMSNDLEKVKSDLTNLDNTCKGTIRHSRTKWQMELRK